jgi:hypothetical protein
MCVCVCDERTTKTLSALLCPTARRQEMRKYASKIDVNHHRLERKVKSLNFSDAVPLQRAKKEVARLHLLCEFPTRERFQKQSVIAFINAHYARCGNERSVICIAIVVLYCDCLTRAIRG